MMNSTLRLAARNTLRRRTRTLLTAGMVVVAVALLLIGLTWVTGATAGPMAQAAGQGGHVRVVTEAYAAREELTPLYENLAGVAATEAAVRALPGVLSAEPRIVSGVSVTAGEEIGDVFAQAVGARESYFRERFGARERLALGGWFTGAEEEAVIGARVAEQSGAAAGDDLVVLGTTQDGSLSSVRVRVVGVLRKGSGAMDQQILMPLQRMQYLTDLEGAATELLVYGESHLESSGLAAALRSSEVLGGTSVSAWNEREPFKSLAASVKGMQAVIVLIFVVLASLGIWNTMTMSVLERTHEIGVLRAMGLSRLGAVGLFVGEALAIAVVGGVAGVLLGLYPSWLLEERGVHVGERVAAGGNFGETIYGDLTPQNVVLVFGIGLLMAVIGSLVPALRAASIQPVSAMRSGR